MNEDGLTPARSKKRPELIVLATFIASSLGAWAMWVHRWQAQNARRQEMYTLYADASTGDRARVRKLATYPSSEAKQLIEKLAQDRNAVADGRLEAIKLLATEQPIASKTLAPLLGIDQPFAIRHAIAQVFEQRGCDQGCISATLAALHDLSSGRPPLEVWAYSQLPSPTPSDQEYTVYLHRQTEEDYFVLLNSNACLSSEILQTNYELDRAFLDLVGKKLGHC